MTTERLAKRRRVLSDPAPDGDASSNAITDFTSKTFLETAPNWSLEQKYEQRAHKKTKEDQQSFRLPIKTVEGRVEHVPYTLFNAEDSSSVLDFEEGSQDTEHLSSDASEPIEEARAVLLPQQVMNAKINLAKIAAQINEDPEGNVDALNKLAEYSKSSHFTIVKLGLATQVAVYRDIMPGYRIQPLATNDKHERVSKEVRRLRHFEQTLVKSYGAFVQGLASFAKGDSVVSPNESLSASSAAVTCACNLLLAAPHFNFRKELLKVIIESLFRRGSDFAYQKCIDTLETLFREDEDGMPSFEAVTLLVKSIRDRRYSVHERVINVFLHLRLLSEFSSKASIERVDKFPSEEHRSEKRKSQRHFRTKRQRKLIKEEKRLDKDFREADAIVSHEHRDKLQADTLKSVFGLYFRILKERTGHLMGPVLEGLAMYAHLINQDFFGDLLEVLRHLINECDLVETTELSEDGASLVNASMVGSQKPERSSLLCINTAIALLAGQDVAKSASSLGLDLTYFTDHLYTTLFNHVMNPDIEGSNHMKELSNAKDTDLLPPEQKRRSPSRINVQTTAVLLIRALSCSLTPRSTSPLRLAAFIKQLYIGSLQLPERSCSAFMALLNDLTRDQGRKVAPLWTTEERKGDGVFDALTKNPGASNPFATNIWDGELLKHHFCPAVRNAVRGVEHTISAEA